MSENNHPYVPIPKKDSSQFIKHSLQYYENKILHQNVPIWVKDIKVGFGIGEDIAFEDFFQLAQLKGGIQESKISGFRVWIKESDGMVQGLQLLYVNAFNQSHVIKGYKITSESQFTQVKFKEFLFGHDEFAIELKGRYGMVIHHFGIQTNKGKYYSFGGKGGEPFSIKARQGYHFTNLGALYSPKWSAISTFSCDAIRLPQNQRLSSLKISQKKQIHFQRPAFRSVIPFLTISEILKLFRLNREFSQFRYDQVVLHQIGIRCVYTGDPKLLKYISKMIKAFPKDVHNSLFDKINNYILLSKNLILNPDGKKYYEGYDVYKNDGGDGITLRQEGDSNCFQFSYGWATLKWSAKLSDILNSEQNKQYLTLENIQNSKYALVFGTCITDSGFGSVARMKIVVEDEKNEEIFSTEKEYKNEISRDYQFFYLKFINPSKDITPEYVSFSVSGKDTCYWAGFYGPKIKNITMKIMPIEDELEKTNFQKYFQ